MKHDKMCGRKKSTKICTVSSFNGILKAHVKVVIMKKLRRCVIMLFDL